jgi:diguanylate cyclase (GGDEF)-like protein/PAS domain S-box-containing protein
MFDESPIGMCSVIADGTILRCNAAFAKLAGAPAGSVLDLVEPAARPALARSLRAIVAGEERSFSLEMRTSGAAGRWCEVSGVVMRGASGDVMLHLVDVTERRRREDDLREQAERDPLTGLQNRTTFHRVLGERLAAEAPGTVMMLDLDGFKAVNDTCGHQRGDAVLIAVAAALRDSMPVSAVIARLGGDEFAVLLEVDARMGMALGTRLVGRIMIAAATLVKAPRVTASIGVAELRPGNDMEAVLFAVDRAMYAAKRAGKARCQMALPIGADADRRSYSA